MANSSFPGAQDESVTIADLRDEPQGLDDLPEQVRQDAALALAGIASLLKARGCALVWRDDLGGNHFFAASQGWHDAAVAHLDLLLAQRPNGVTSIERDGRQVRVSVLGVSRLSGDFVLCAFGASGNPIEAESRSAEQIARFIVRTTRGARFNDRLEEGLRASSVVSDLLSVVLEPGPLDELLGKLANRIGVSTGEAVVAIDSIDDDSMQMERNLYVDPSLPDAARLAARWRELLSIQRRRDWSHGREAIQQWRAPYLIQDLQDPAVLSRSGPEERAFYETAGIHTVALFPLWVRDQFVGILSFTSRQTRQYTARDLRRLERIAAVVATAIRGVQLFNAQARSYELERRAYVDSISRLAAAAEGRDQFTARHLKNIRLYTEEIAREMGQPGPFVEVIGEASEMHDIGKIVIPDSILLKPGPLSAEERAIMQTHTLQGERLLVGRALHVAREVAHFHHEWWDGRGYPDCLNREAIPLSARIVAVADVYDALTSRRPYKEAWPVEEAYEEIVRCAGSQFDPGVVEAFKSLWQAGALSTSHAAAS